MSPSSLRPARVFALGAALITLITVFADPSAAQNVIVRNAPPGGEVELRLNAATPRRVTASATGVASAQMSLPDGVAEAIVVLFVDRCGRETIVRLIGPGVPPAPAGPGCTRSDAGAQFVVRPVTSFVIDVGGSGVSVRMRQGPPFASWLVDATDVAGGVTLSSQPRSGLTVFGGAGVTIKGDGIGAACGNVSCEGRQLHLGGQGGLTYWLTPHLGAEVVYVKPRMATANGGGANYAFDSAFESNLLIVAANVGGRSGNVRYYGQAGANFHQALFTQTETTGVTAQTFVLNTEGWGWSFGGGVETWISPRLAIYVEGQMLSLQGDDVSGGPARTDERMAITMAGLRLRLF